jgi:hypothetical protein
LVATEGRAATLGLLSFRARSTELADACCGLAATVARAMPDRSPECETLQKSKGLPRWFNEEIGENHA